MFLQSGSGFALGSSLVSGCIDRVHRTSDSRPALGQKRTLVSGATYPPSRSMTLRWPFSRADEWLLQGQTGDFIWRTARGRLCWQNSQFEVYESSLCVRRQQLKKEMADGIVLVLAGAADERV